MPDPRQQQASAPVAGRLSQAVWCWVWWLVNSQERAVLLLTWGLLNPAILATVPPPRSDSWHKTIVVVVVVVVVVIVVVVAAARCCRSRPLLLQAA